MADGYGWLSLDDDGTFGLRWNDDEDPDPLYREDAEELLAELQRAIPRLLTRDEHDAASGLTRFAAGVKRWRAEWVDAFGAKMRLGMVEPDTTGFYSFTVRRVP